MEKQLKTKKYFQTTASGLQPIVWIFGVHPCTNIGFPMFTSPRSRKHWKKKPKNHDFQTMTAGHQTIVWKSWFLCLLFFPMFWLLGCKSIGFPNVFGFHPCTNIGFSTVVGFHPCTNIGFPMFSSPRSRKHRKKTIKTKNHDFQTMTSGLQPVVWKSWLSVFIVFLMFSAPRLQNTLCFPMFLAYAIAIALFLPVF